MTFDRPVGPDPLVDWRASLALLGRVLQYLTVAFVVPIAVAVRYGDPLLPYLIPAAIAVVAGRGLERLDTDPELGAREGFLLVAVTWLVVSLFGAVVYLVAGWLPVVAGGAAAPASTLANPVNALFESMSGFTTTGATVVGELSFERHSRALLMWRQLSQWLGGMGIVVLAVAILPELSVGGTQLMDAEAPGPGVEKLTPRIAETARALWLAYAAITLVEMALLYGLHLGGLAPEMTFYQAVAHGFTTMATGGFSPQARSIEAFSAAVQWLVIPFMVAAGTDFALIWRAMNGEPGRLVGDDEFRFYLGLVGVLSAVVAGTLYVDPALVAPVVAEAGPTAAVAGDVGAALRHGTFQVVSMVTTTGYASMDFDAWSGPAQYLLVFAMFVGGSAGSTGGAVKIVRWLVIAKSIRRELFTTVHPEAVRTVRLNGRSLDEDALRGIYVFTLLYVVIFLVGGLLLAVDAAVRGYGLTPLAAITASASTLGNVGPGLGAIGPMDNYLVFSPEAKLLMVGLMWIGRLEIFPVLVLLTRGYWRS